MDLLKSLKLTTTKTIDTSMAKEYINTIQKDQWPESDAFILETNKSTEIKIDNISQITTLKLRENFQENLKTKNRDDIGNTIAKKIEENTEMFVQLEYLARGTDSRDVRDGHLKLMSQLAQCSTSIWSQMTTVHDYFLLFNETTPLYTLAFVFMFLYSYETESQPTIIIKSKKLKPLCKFFVDICRDAGLEVHLVYSGQDEIDTSVHIYQVPVDVGCTGVVVERADIDSAIDCIIDSSLSAPWRFKQIYVQESIFEDFTEALKAKASVVDGNIAVGNKTFLLEISTGDASGLPLSAFRTAREVIDLINTPYLSLWAAETALSHEIALRSTSSTVWINDYASFYGPPRSALSVGHLTWDIRALSTCDVKQTLSRWSKLQTEERYNAIVAALAASTHENGPKLYLSDFRKAYRSEALLEVTNKTICFGVQKQLSLNLPYTFVEPIKHAWLNVLKALLNGNGVYCERNRLINEEIDELQKFGIPISHYTSATETYNLCLSCPMLVEKLKVVRTNYGTIFAN